MPDIDNGIFFLDDINEAPYRVERMIYHLFHAGILQRQQAILLSDFRCDNPSVGNGYDLQKVVVTHFHERLEVPILTGLPFGHIRDKLTLPIGATCQISATTQQFQLNFSRVNAARNDLNDARRGNTGAALQAFFAKTAISRLVRRTTT